MRAALHALRKHDPASLTCAVPVAAPSALADISPHADAVTCLAAPDDFEGVGQFYLDFRQVEDSEVVRALAGGTGPDPPSGRTRPGSQRPAANPTPSRWPGAKVSGRAIGQKRWNTACSGTPSSRAPGSTQR